MKNTRAVVALAAAAAMMLPGAAFAAESPAEPGSTVGNPIIVSSPDEVPEGAVQDEVSTYTDPASKCATTSSWTVTVPAVEEVSHQEYRFKRDVPAVEGVKEQRYAKTIEHPAVPRETANRYKWSRRVYTVLAEPSVPGTGSHWELEDKWRKEGDVPSGEGWEICWDRYVFDEDGNNTGEKEYQWHQLIPGTPFKPAVKAQFYYQNTDYLWEGESPSDEWPADAVGVEEWKRGGLSVAITKPYEPAWTETVFFNGKPGGTTDESQAAWVTYAPTGYAPHGEPRWNPEPADAYSVYYNGTEDGSLEESDAAWVKYAPTGDWTKFDERKVVDVEAVPESVTFYAYSDEKECAVVVPPTEETPAEEPPVIEIGEPEGPIFAPTPRRYTPDPAQWVDDPGTNEYGTLASAGSEVNVLGVLGGAAVLAGGLMLGYFGLGRRNR